MKNKGGRPVKGIKSKSVPAMFYITVEDDDKLKEMIVRSKLTRSSFLYKIYKEGVVNIYERPGLNIEQLRLFGFANNNLNQIARQINTSKQTVLDIQTLNVLQEIATNLAKILPDDR